MSKIKNYEKIQYILLKWKPDVDYENKKSWRDIIDMREKNIEEELIQNHEQTYGNKREICSQRLACRDKIIHGTINPFMIKNNYLDDLTNQDIYLRPQDSNIKTNDNKYLKKE